MSKHQSRRKQRQADRLSLHDQVVNEVRDLASRPFVLSIEDDFAGYFNELGISVALATDSTDQDVILLRNDLLDRLECLLPHGRSSFTWLVTFKRGGSTVEVLTPVDEPRELTDALVPL